MRTPRPTRPPAVALLLAAAALGTPLGVYRHVGELRARDIAGLEAAARAAY